MTFNPHSSWSRPTLWQRLWILYPVVAFASAALLYKLLPRWGIALPMPPAEKLMLLGAGAVGALLYFLMLELLLKRPWWIILYILLFWRLLEYGNNVITLLQLPLPTLPVRILTLVIIGLPCTIIAFKQFILLWKELPYFKWMVSFMTIILLYFLFYNMHFVDPSGTFPAYIDISRSFLLNTFNFMLCIVICYYGIKQHPNSDQFFDAINRMILIYSIVEGLCVVLGYPLRWFAIDVDGYIRAEGFTSHPNNLAHDVAIRIFYTLGLIGYYGHSVSSARIKPGLLFTALGLMLFTALLALSKGSLSIASSLIALYLCVLAIWFKQPKPLLYSVLGISLLVPVFLLSFQVLTGGDFIEMLQSRIDNVGSLTFRTEAWNALLSNITPSRYLVGMGLSASNEFMNMLQLNNTLLNKTGSSLPYVHNFSVNLFYDMGLLGLSFYLVPFFYARAIGEYLQERFPMRYRLLALSGLLMLAYIVVAWQTDEIAFSTNAILPWSLMTLIFSLLFKNWGRLNVVGK